MLFGRRKCLSDGAGEPAVAPDRGGIAAFLSSTSHQPPRQVNGIVSTKGLNPTVRRGLSMTRERLIWRPNAIPPDVWETMSRDDQIAWWKAQEKPPEPKRHMKVAISMYEKGIVTLGEFVCLVYKLAAAEEIEEFMRLCPPDMLATLKESLASYGDDEKTWPRVIYSACYASPDLNAHWVSQCRSPQNSMR